MSRIYKDTPLGKTFRRFFKNKLAVSGLVLISIFFAIAVLGYWIMPDNTPMANRMAVQLSTKKPGSTFTFLKIRRNSPDVHNNIFNTLLYGKVSEYERVAISEYSIIGDSLIAIAETGVQGDVGDRLAWTLPDIVYALPPDKQEIRLQGENIYFTDISGAQRVESLTSLKSEVEKEHVIQKTFWLGTDLYGRDMLSRMILGARVSLSVGLMSVLISLFIGIVLGAMAGYFGGKIDSAISWFMNVVWSLPSLLLAIAVSFALGKGFWQVFIAIGLTMWVDVARLVRGQVMGLREVEYVEAGKALGFSNQRIIGRHILPNIVGPILVMASANFASAILLEAGLSFLGFGAQPPFPTWGAMIKEHYGYIIIDAAYLAIIPGVAIMLVVYAFNVLSVGLRDAFDVKVQKNTL